MSEIGEGDYTPGAHERWRKAMQPFINQQINRPTPGLPAHQMVSYQLRAPLRSHWRPATCEEVGCASYTNGWKTIVAKGSPEEDLAKASGRKYTLKYNGTLAEFTFHPGNVCFTYKQHRVRLDKDFLYIRRGGDHRGNPTGEEVIHRRPELWVEDFSEHQDRLKRLVERG